MTALFLCFAFLDHGEESIDSTESVDTSESESVVGPGGVTNVGANLARELKVAVSVVLQNGLNVCVAHVAALGSQETNKTSDMGAGHGSSRHGGVGSVAAMTGRADLVTWSRDLWLLGARVGWSTGAEGGDGISGGRGTDSDDISTRVSWRSSSTARWARIGSGEDWDHTSGVPSADDSIEPGLATSTSPRVGGNIWSLGTVWVVTLIVVWAGNELTASGETGLCA